MQLEKHGDVCADNHFGLRERDNPEVKACLTAENEYGRAVMDGNRVYID